MDIEEIIRDYEIHLGRIFKNEKIKILVDEIIPGTGIYFSVHFIEKEYFNFYKRIEETKLEEIIKPIYDWYRHELITKNINIDYLMRIVGDKI